MHYELLVQLLLHEALLDAFLVLERAPLDQIFVNLVQNRLVEDHLTAASAGFTRARGATTSSLVRRAAGSAAWEAAVGRLMLVAVPIVILLA